MGRFISCRIRAFAPNRAAGLYPAAIAELKSLGMKAELLQGKFLSNKKDVMGLMVGTAQFDLDAANLNILPGAFCDHLTSYGGDLQFKGDTDAAHRFSASRRGRGERDRYGTLRHRAEIPVAVSACPLRQRVLPRGVVLPVGRRPLPTASRRRRALSAVGRGRRKSPSRGLNRATVKGKVRLHPEAISPLGARRSKSFDCSSTVG